MNAVHSFFKTFLTRNLCFFTIFVSMDVHASIYTLEEFLQQVLDSNDKELHIVLGRVKADDPLDPLIEQKLRTILPVRSNVPVILAQPNYFLLNFGDHLKFKPEALTGFLIEQKGKSTGKQNFRLVSLEDLNLASIEEKAEYVFRKVKLEKPEIRNNFADELLAVEELIPSKNFKNSFEDIAWLLGKLRGFSIKVTVLDGDFSTFDKLNTLLASLEVLGPNYFSKVDVFFLMQAILSASGFYPLYFPTLEQRLDWIDFQVKIHLEQNFWPLSEFRKRSDYKGFQEANFALLNQISILYDLDYLKKLRKKLRREVMHTHRVDLSEEFSKSRMEQELALSSEGLGIEITRHVHKSDVGESTWVVTVRDFLNTKFKFNLKVLMKGRLIEIPPFKLPCGTGYAYTFSIATDSLTAIEVKTRAGMFFFSKADLLSSKSIQFGETDFLPKEPTEVFKDYEDKLIHFEVERIFTEDALGKRFLSVLSSEKSKFVEALLSEESTVSLIPSSMNSCESAFSSGDNSSNFTADEINAISRLRTRVKSFANSVYTKFKDVRLEYDKNRK